MKGFLAIFFSILFLVWGGARIVQNIQFDRGCEGYLKRAADANTVRLAEENLEVAVNYAEREGYTDGYTSIIYKTPDEDVEFWYDNLTASLEELRSVDSTATQLERSNVLMKLRETLLDDEKDGTAVTVPRGVSVFPMNTLYAIWGCFSPIFAVVFGVWWGIDNGL